MSLGSTEPFRRMRTRVINEWEYPVAANVVIKKGEPLLIVAGNLKPCDGTAASGDIYGFALEGVDNSSGAAGDKTCIIDFCRVLSCVAFPPAAASPPTLAACGTVVNIDALSKVTVAAGNKAGKLIGKSTSNGMWFVAINEKQ